MYWWKRSDSYGPGTCFSVPSHSCVVLQFDSERICGECFSLDKCYHPIKQCFQPLENHVILRKDRIYLYPDPIDISVGALIANNGTPPISHRYHSYIQLLYYNLRYFDHHYYFQKYFVMQRPVEKEFRKCGVTIFTPQIFVPMKVFLEAISTYKEEILRFQFSYMFAHLKYYTLAKYLIWEKYFSSWLSSTLYYVNCSRIFEMPSVISKSGNILKICKREDNVLNFEELYHGSSSCLGSPYLIDKTISQPYVLSIYAYNYPSILDYPLFSLYFENIFKHICDEKGYYNKLNISTLYYETKFLKLECLTLVIVLYLHTSHFQNGNNFKFDVEMSTVHYIKIYNPSVGLEELEIMYRWHKKNGKSSKNKEEYKLFASDKDFSWNKALLICIKHNLSLPNFENKGHLDDTLDNIKNIYGFYPLMIYVGTMYSVSTVQHMFQYNIIFQLNIIIFKSVLTCNYNYIIFIDLQAERSMLWSTTSQPNIFLPVQFKKMMTKSLMYLMYKDDFGANRTLLRIYPLSGNNSQKITRFPESYIFHREGYFYYGKVLEKFTFSKSIPRDICYILLLTNTFSPTLHPIFCDMKILNFALCVNYNGNNSKFKYGSIENYSSHIRIDFINIFLCSDGTYISISNVCDGQMDCPAEPSEEINCTCRKDGKLTSYCSEMCNPSNCTCSDFYLQVPKGGCHLYISFPKVHMFSTNTFSNQSLVQFNQENNYINSYEYYEDNMIKCLPGFEQCYYKYQACQYIVDRISGFLSICFNGKHLENCQAVQCQKSIKCPNSYCIPYSYVCDGKWDCWNGADERNCATRTCTTLYKCSHSSICISLDLICDKLLNCPYGDDENICHFCVQSCTCVALAIICKHTSISGAEKINFVSYLSITILFSVVPTPLNFTQALRLILSHNQFREFWEIVQSGNYSTLILMAVTFNDIKEILPSPRNIQLDSLTHLNLSNNRISSLYNFAFASLHSLKHLDLSSNKIISLSSKTFKGLSLLKSLQISENLLSKVKVDTFSHLSIELLVTNRFEVCCVLRNSKGICTIKDFYHSGCDQLLPNQIFQILGILFGFSIIVVNILSVICYLGQMFTTDSAQEAKLIYHTLNVILNISDFCTAIYILVITFLDVVKRHKFVEISTDWQKSFFCQLLSIFSMTSQVFSSILVFYISLSRYLVVAYPFSYLLNYKRLKTLLFITLMVISVLASSVYVNHNVNCFDTKMTTPLCFFAVDMHASLTLTIITFFILFIWIIVITLSITFYILLYKTSCQLQNEFSHSLQKQPHSSSILVNMSITVLTNCFYYGTLCTLCILLYLLKPSQSHLQYYLIFTVIPFGPLLNPFVYHFSKLKSLFLRCSDWRCSINSLGKW